MTKAQRVAVFVVFFGMLGCGSGSNRPAGNPNVPRFSDVFVVVNVDRLRSEHRR